MAAALSSADSGLAITMTGEITHGDAERIAAIFLVVKQNKMGFYPYSIYLNSPGGDVAEAIRIADLVKALGLTVATIPDGRGACASSCFLIYVAALERRATGFDTLKTQGLKGRFGPLGIHRPHFRMPADGRSGAEQQEQAMIDMRAYLIKSGVGHALIDKMMAHASNDIYWLNAEEVRSLGSFSPGVEEQLIANCGYDARREATLSDREYIQSSRSGALACVRHYMSKTYTPLRDAAIDQMRTGWRPWK